MVILSSSKDKFKQYIVIKGQTESEMFVSFKQIVFPPI